MTETRKKTGTTSKKKKKKKTSSSSIRLSAAEKKLITNYRKCNALYKEVISLVVEKAAGGSTDKLADVSRMFEGDNRE